MDGSMDQQIDRHKKKKKSKGASSGHKPATAYKSLRIDDVPKNVNFRPLDVSRSSSDSCRHLCSSCAFEWVVNYLGLDSYLYKSQTGT